MWEAAHLSPVTRANAGSMIVLATSWRLGSWCWHIRSNSLSLPRIALQDMIQGWERLHTVCTVEIVWTISIFEDETWNLIVPGKEIFLTRSTLMFVFAQGSHDEPLHCVGFVCSNFVCTAEKPTKVGCIFHYLNLASEYARVMQVSCSFWMFSCEQRCRVLCNTTWLSYHVARSHIW